jgi:hypothetical protein
MPKPKLDQVYVASGPNLTPLGKSTLEHLVQDLKDQGYRATQQSVLDILLKLTKGDGSLMKRIASGLQKRHMS